MKNQALVLRTRRRDRGKRCRNEVGTISKMDSREATRLCSGQSRDMNDLSSELARQRTRGSGQGDGGVAFQLPR